MKVLNMVSSSNEGLLVVTTEMSMEEHAKFIVWSRSLEANRDV